MKLQSIRLSEFRRFSRGLEILDLQPGLNLFTGPNEAGKSTIAAAIRAAFLERYNTSKVADFAPRGQAGPRPQVELDFQLGGKTYHLSKAFLNKPRCELIIDGSLRLEGEQAQTTLASLLGFEFAGKGQSRPEHAGVPGLLWIQQGDSPSLLALQHAGAHVRDALNRVSGELAVGDGDRLLQRVSAERAELLDLRGKPRGAYREAEDKLAQALAERDKYASARETLNAAVDKLAGLRAAHVQDERDQPWQQFENKAAQARARQQAIRQEKAELEALRRDCRQAEETLALLHEQVRRDQQDDDELKGLRAQLLETEQARIAAAAALQGAEAVRVQAHAGLAAARNAYEAARLAAEKRDVGVMAERQGAELQRLERAAQQATNLAARHRELQQAIAGLDMQQADLQALRQACRELDNLAVRRQAAATRLQYQLPQGGLSLDGEPLHGSGERHVTASASLTLVDGGSLQIIPGGADLAALASQESVLRGRQAQLLQALAVATLEQAEARWLDFDAARREADAVRRELAIHAPDGVEALQNLIEDARRLMLKLNARLAEPGLAQAGAVIRDQQALQSELTAAEAALARAQTQLDTCRERVQEAESLGQQLAARCGTLAQRLGDAASVARREHLGRRLAETRSQRDDIERRVLRAESAIAAYRPDLVEQDIDRFDRSARYARDAFHARQREILLLQGRLDEAGEQGIGESLAQSQAESERLLRRRDALHGRAQALNLLHHLLQTQRDAATQRLQAPLTRRLNHYLRLLFPEAQLRLDDMLLPSGMVRDGDEDALSGLSFGTQEQLGILARFAYADLLQEAGRPTLLILDDAMVHTDEHRREWMKRALFDAASRHQILMFTCHAAAWKDLGVPQRELASL